MLVSSKEISPQDVLDAYYTRQTAEQIFGFSKSNLEILPLRNHSDATVSGYLFLQFLLLIVFIEIRSKLGKKSTVEQAFLHLKSLRCKVYDDKLILQELTKTHKQIFELLSVIVPDINAGI